MMISGESCRIIKNNLYVLGWEQTGIRMKAAMIYSSFPFIVITWLKTARWTISKYSFRVQSIISIQFTADPETVHMKFTFYTAHCIYSCSTVHSLCFLLPNSFNMPPLSKVLWLSFGFWLFPCRIQIETSRAESICFGKVSFTVLWFC